MKATYGEIKAKPQEIFKDPITDDGTKKSAKGLLAIYKDEGTGRLFVKDQVSWKEEDNCELQTVFKDGKLVKETSLLEIRNKLNQTLQQWIKKNSSTTEMSLVDQKKVSH